MSGGLQLGQIINGQTYQQYSPEWYDAMRADKATNAGANGAAAGTGVSAFLNNLPPSMQGLMYGATSSATGGTGAFGTGGSVGAGSGGPVGSGAGVNPLSMPDMTGANDAAFATAKDKAGKLGRASLTSLNDEMGATGMLGSGAAAQGTKDIVSDAAGQLGQVSRDQAVSGANLAADTAKTNYAGAITQRGQDINAQEANARLALEQSQLAYQRNTQLLNLAIAGLSGGAQTASTSLF